MRKWMMGCLLLVVSVSFTGCGGNMSAMQQGNQSQSQMSHMSNMNMSNMNMSTTAAK